MTKKEEGLTHARRIALILDGSSATGQRMMTGLYRRATSYAQLRVRRYFEHELTSQGIGSLMDWKPDAVIAYCNDTTLLQQVRNALPGAPAVCMSAMPPGIADVVVTGNANELVGLSREHFLNNGLVHYAMFYAGEAEAAKIQSDFWHGHLKNKSETFHEYRYDSNITDLLHTPATESVDEIGTWLKSLPKPVGIYCPCDHAAAYLVRICSELGLDIPADVQLIGCDELDESLECLPHITSFDVPAERIGSTALETIFKLLDGEKIHEQILRVDGATLIPQGSTGMVPSQTSNIPAAIAYIESNAVQGIHVNDVYEQTQCASLMSFYRDFKIQTGELPALYIRRVRLDTARRLLATTQLNITRIAELAGFSSSNYFAQIFRKEQGMTPLQYRNAHKNKKT